MKKFVCSKVRFIEDKFITSIENGVVNFVEGKTWETINFVNATIAEDFSNSFVGKQITQSLHVEGEFDTDNANRLMLPLIFELMLSDGRTLIWGDKKLRAKINKQTMTIGSGVSIFERKTKNFEL